jgi:hypothetical protein
MKITQGCPRLRPVQAAAEAGLAEKSVEFRERGSEVYLPMGVAAANTEAGVGR